MPRGILSEYFQQQQTHVLCCPNCGPSLLSTDFAGFILRIGILLPLIMELNGSNGFPQYSNDNGTEFHAQVGDNYRDRDAMYKLIIR